MAANAPPPASGGKTYVLVHGAFHGGWCWQRVARHLRAAGHEVYTPTQTGLGERRHLLHAGITMDVFVEDIAALVEAEELQDIVLVGHSFGGGTVAGVADRMPQRRRLTPHPLATYRTAVTLRHPPGNGVPTTFIRCTDPPYANIAASAAYARSRSDWEYLELRAGHDAMVSAAAPLAALLGQLA